MANLHINENTEIGNTGVSIGEFLKQYNNTRLPHFIETRTNMSFESPNIHFGREDAVYRATGLMLFKTGHQNEMTEWYGGVYIPDISKYYMLIVEVNSGGFAPNSQLNGGIYLWDYTNKKTHIIYDTSWREQILTPQTNNYNKVILNKIMRVDDMTGSWCICCLFSRYGSGNIEWNGGFGNGGSSMRVIGILK